MTKYELGKWDLTELARNSKSPEFANKLDVINKKSQEFEKLRTKLTPSISAKSFLSILNKIEDISEKTSIVGGYASLSYAADTQSDENTALMSKVTKIASDIENRILFFDLWWKRKNKHIPWLEKLIRI